MIYFDHNSTTRPAPEVLAAVSEAGAGVWGNPSSPHRAGQKARLALEEAREKVAALFGVEAQQVYFNSGGTEGANQILLGGDALSRGGHLITTAVEHACVLAAAEAFEESGGVVTRLGVDSAGRVDPAAVRAAIRKDTRLISVMAANNDTGVMQPIREVADIARSEAIPFHTDAVQIAGRISFDLRDSGADFATISGHKLYGPKGSGAIICGSTRRPPALIRGGEQERGLRAGTENIPAIVGLGVAAELALRYGLEEVARQTALRDRLEESLRAICPDAVVHGAGAERLPNTSNMAFPGVSAAALITRLDLEDIAVTTTSACESQVANPPHVLVAMGLPPALSLASVRFSLGRDNTAEEVERVVETIGRILPEMRGS